MPIEVAGHKDPKTKGYRGLNSRESLFILVTLGELAFCWNCILFNLGLIYTI